MSMTPKLPNLSFRHTKIQTGLPVTELAGIQYLRAVGALFVVIFHLAPRPFGDSLSILGAAGVNIFFIISGFIMWVTTADRRLTPGNFMLRRIIRIVPNYWFATIAMAVLILVRPNFTHDSTVDPYRFIGSLLFFPTLSESGISPIVTQGWSLVYEMMFYGIFACSLLLGRRYRPVFIAGVLGAFLIFHATIKEPHIVALTNLVVVEFLAGIVLGVLWKDLRISHRSAAYTFLAGAAALTFFGCFWQNLPEVLSAGVPSILVVAGAAFYEKARTVKKIPILQILGDASYSIYIWHIFIATVLQGLLLRTPLSSPLRFSLMIAGTVLMSCIVYILVEHPITQYLRARLAMRPSTLRPA